MQKITSNKDLIMVLLYAKGHKQQQCEPIRGRTRLMKMIFLFDKEIRKTFHKEIIDENALPKFVPYNFGPFSAEVYSDLEFLEDLEFISKNKTQDEVSEEAYLYALYDISSEDIGNNVEEEFFLTDLGKRFVEADKAGKLTREQWNVIDEFKARCTAASLKSLLKYVYTKYPEMAEESKILDEIFQR